MTNPVIEAMARAICWAGFQSDPKALGTTSDEYWATVHKHTKAGFRIEARAALEALRDNISDEMTEAGAGNMAWEGLTTGMQEYEFQEGVRALIDTAMKEET